MASTSHETRTGAIGRSPPCSAWPARTVYVRWHARAGTTGYPFFRRQHANRCAARDGRLRTAAASGGAFSVLHFDPAAAGILEQIRRELAPHVPDALTAELYNLNVYGTGGHFVPHKDTPRGGDMLGTLVVCLPAQFSHGAFVVKHRGVFQTYDWGHDIADQTEPTRIYWAAFFGDVDYQIEQVW